MSKHETHLTRAYWERLGEGTLYEEFGVVQVGKGSQVRRVDGVVVLGTLPRIAAPKERRTASLDGKDVIVIQTKATRLNPYVFGQALLSKELISMRWAPRSVRSVLICGADDPELRPIIESFDGVAVHIAPVDHLQSFRLSRVKGAPALAAERLKRPLIRDAPLSSRLKVEGVFVDSLNTTARPLREVVTGGQATSLHSYMSKGVVPNIGMSVSGEAIIAQALLTRMGAKSVDSVIVSNHDVAVEQALRRHARFEVMTPDLL